MKGRRARPHTPILSESPPQSRVQMNRLPLSAIAQKLQFSSDEDEEEDEVGTKFCDLLRVQEGDAVSPLPTPRRECASPFSRFPLGARSTTPSGEKKPPRSPRVRLASCNECPGTPDHCMNWRKLRLGDTPYTPKVGSSTYSFAVPSMSRPFVQRRVPCSASLRTHSQTAAWGFIASGLTSVNVTPRTCTG